MLGVNNGSSLDPVCSNYVIAAAAHWPLFLGDFEGLGKWHCCSEGLQWALGDPWTHWHSLSNHSNTQTPGLGPSSNITTRETTKQREKGRGKICTNFSCLHGDGEGNCGEGNDGRGAKEG